MLKTCLPAGRVIFLLAIVADIRKKGRNTFYIHNIYYKLKIVYYLPRSWTIVNIYGNWNNSEQVTTGAGERTWTSMGLLPLAPKASASAISPPRHIITIFTYQILYKHKRQVRLPFRHPGNFSMWSRIFSRRRSKISRPRLAVLHACKTSLRLAHARNFPQGKFL